MSGIQSTADSFHFGNWLGALRHWVALQETHETFYCVVDLHALTVQPEPEALRRRTRTAAAQLLGLGLDPDRCSLFLQSHVPEHAELAWILSCLTGYGEASRMTQFKDKSARQGAAATSVGLFTYPVLMAADILLYRADVVPVGEDQRQHLELTRTLAERFNHRYGETFVVPEPSIVKDTAKIVDLQEPAAKMSKTAESQAGVLDLLEDPASLRKKIMRAVTDTGTEVRAAPDKPGVSNLLTIYAALSGRTVEDLEKEYAGRGYGDLKRGLADLVVEVVAPVQERTRAYLDDPDQMDAILAAGAARAREVAAGTMAAVRDRLGLVAPPLTDHLPS
jgi:tryptophanyl-tRNA synthetase